MSEFAQPLREEDVDPDPFRQFSAWFSDATRAGVRAPEAASVATASADGAPSVRIVLVKRHDPGGFVFFTNYQSRKGRELTANPRAALMFFWDVLGRQVRVEGPVLPTTREESEEYIRGRPRSSQISALASPQSEIVRDRPALEQRVAEVAARCSGGDPPLPAAWGGFRLVPETFEFWQHRDDRLHDRLRYTGVGVEGPGGVRGGWRLERLAP